MILSLIIAIALIIFGYNKKKESRAKVVELQKQDFNRRNSSGVPIFNSYEDSIKFEKDMANAKNGLNFGSMLFTFGVILLIGTIGYNLLAYNTNQKWHRN